MKLNGKKKIVPYLFILPWMIGFVVFTLSPPPPDVFPVYEHI